MSMSDVIKAQIPGWLAGKALDAIDDHYTPSPQGYDAQEVCESFGLPATATREQIRACVTKEVMNPARWARQSKTRWDAGDGWVPDVAGTSAPAGVDLTKHRWRVFAHRHPMIGDNFRLEVLTDPADREIVAWTLIVD